MTVGKALVRSFRESEADIHEVLCANPDELLQRLAMQLSSRGLISKVVRNSAYDTRGSSISERAFAVLRAVNARIDTDADNGPPFKNFCTVMSKYVALQHISTRMMRGMFPFLRCFLPKLAFLVLSR